MSYAEFQGDWEQAASAEYDGYLALPAAALIAERWVGKDAIRELSSAAVTRRLAARRTPINSLS